VIGLFDQCKQIKREVEIAADGGMTIVPLRIENILPTGRTVAGTTTDEWHQKARAKGIDVTLPVPPLRRTRAMVGEKASARSF